MAKKEEVWVIAHCAKCSGFKHQLLVEKGKEQEARASMLNDRCPHCAEETESTFTELAPIT